MESKSESIQVGAGAVVVRDGKILLAKRKGSHGEGTYGSFGGHVEFGESPVETVKREAMEELGIEVGNVQFVSCTNLQKYGKHYVDLSFTCEIIGGNPKIMESDKIESVGWYDIGSLPEPLFEPVRIVLDAMDSDKFYFDVRDV